MLKDSEIEDRRPARPMQEPKTGLPTPSEGDNPAPTSGKSGKFGLFLMGLLVVAALVATAMLLQHRAANAKKAPISRALPPVTVVADTVRNKDVPIYLDGLGTVQAFNTVTVHVRVDGQLQKVAFSE